jgi:hypothetical protein
MLTNFYLVPAERKAAFRGSFEVLTFTDTETTLNNDFAFNAESDKNKIAIAAFIGSREEKEGYNVITVSCDGTFGLAPNLLVRNKTKSIAGGIFASDEDSLEEQRANLTTEDIKDLKTWLYLWSF